MLLYRSCFVSVRVAFEGNFQEQAPGGLYYGGFLRYEFGGRGIYLEGPIHEGAYFRNFTALQLCVRYNTVCIFYGTCLQSTRFK